MTWTWNCPTYIIACKHKTISDHRNKQKQRTFQYYTATDVRFNMSMCYYTAPITCIMTWKISIRSCAQHVTMSEKQNSGALYVNSTEWDTHASNITLYHY